MSMLDDDIIVDLSMECERMKALLHRALPEIQMRLYDIKVRGSYQEFYADFDRNERLALDIETALEDWEPHDTET